MTDIQAVRLLIGDQLSASFTDDEIAAFNSLAGVDGPGSEYFFAASMALGSIAAKTGTNLSEVRLGDFSDSSGRNKVSSIQAQAKAYLDLYYNTPAFAIAESDESDMNALIIIRNYVLRTTP